MWQRREEMAWNSGGMCKVMHIIRHKDVAVKGIMDVKPPSDGICVLKRGNTIGGGNMVRCLLGWYK
jgi:hypothetical protein